MLLVNLTSVATAKTSGPPKLKVLERKTFQVVTQQNRALQRTADRLRENIATEVVLHLKDTSIFLTVTHQP